MMVAVFGGDVAYEAARDLWPILRHLHPWAL